MKTSLKTLLFALILGIATAYAADGEIRISGPYLTTLAGIDCSTATTINIGSCHGLTSLAGLNAPAATTIIIAFCGGLTSLDGLNAPAATTINLSWCPNLTSLAGLNAPAATTIITTNPLLQAEANEIVRQNLAWSDNRAAWCSTVGRITEALNGTRATAETTNTTGDEAGPAGAGSGACAHNGRRGL